MSSGFSPLSGYYEDTTVPVSSQSRGRPFSSAGSGNYLFYVGNQPYVGRFLEPLESVSEMKWVLRFGNGKTAAVPKRLLSQTNYPLSPVPPPKGSV
ncbi:unnamed protein product [Somion occarium]|uniref:Uncharacterized protein n=1 Tax=Somion occarium TaxID=3059160 RepID=A0ABP1DUN7_9APHY